MIDTGSIVAFIIVSFSLAAILLMKRDTLAPQFRRGLALLALVMVAFSFFLIVYSFWTMG